MHERGIYNSMIGVPSLQANPNARQEVLARVKRLCQITSENIKYLQINDEMKHRTFVVRYEDIAVEPFDYAKRILDFAGLNYTFEVDNWIVENTQGKTGTRQNLVIFHCFTTKILNEEDQKEFLSKNRLFLTL